ncbi:MAG: FtsQ-type POTRA domain-containing protein [Candidatus Marinimicrobia bacterium]|nr:FtsQ-type POTRA domain-containing protein [Candidatus Neomarinimicrobiota bacterium]
MLKKIWNHTPEILYRVFIVFAVIISTTAIWNYSEVSQLYSYKNTVVAGNGYIPTDQVLEIANINKNETVLDLDLGDVAKRLSAYSFIKSQKISRVFPSTIRIDVIEREPFAVVKCHNGMAILDRDGVIIPHDPAIGRSFNLPTIKGETEKVSITELSSKDNASWVRTQTQFLLAIEKRLPELFSASQSIGIEMDQLIFHHIIGRTCIQLDMTNCEEQTEKLVSFYRTVEKLRRLTDYNIIDLRTPGQVIVVENNIGRS